MTHLYSDTSAILTGGEHVKNNKIQNSDIYLLNPIVWYTIEILIYIVHIVIHTFTINRINRLKTGKSPYYQLAYILDIIQLAKISETFSLQSTLF